MPFSLPLPRHYSHWPITNNNGIGHHHHFPNNNGNGIIIWPKGVVGRRGIWESIDRETEWNRMGETECWGMGMVDIVVLPLSVTASAACHCPIGEDFLFLLTGEGLGMEWGMELKEWNGRGEAEGWECLGQWWQVIQA